MQKSSSVMAGIFCHAQVGSLREDCDFFGVQLATCLATVVNYKLFCAVVGRQRHYPEMKRL